MSPVNVVAIFEAIPGDADNLRKVLFPIEPASRLEQGCINYSVSESQSVPGVFVVVETWKSGADLGRHAKSPHMVAALNSMKSLLASDPTVHILRAISE